VAFYFCQVWVVPCGARPDKPSVRSSALRRFLMAVLSVEARLPEHFPVVVSAIEVFEEVALARWVGAVAMVGLLLCSTLTERCWSGVFVGPAMC